MDSIDFKHFSVGPMDNNVYILSDSTSGESILFDAPGDPGPILDALEGTTLRYILMTHADSDHVGALREIQRATGARVGINLAERERLPIEPDFAVNDGDTIRAGAIELRAIYTPGHSPGGMCYLFGDRLMAGDTLFPGGPGNTARADGDFDLISSSIRTKLFVLPDDTRVYPGHGLPTTIGEEKVRAGEWQP